MNEIEKLIQELCPDGVEYRRLGEVCVLQRGKVISKDYIRDNQGIYPVYSSQTANNGILGYINSFMFDGDYLTWTTDGAYAGTVFRRKGKFNITNVCGLINSKDDFVNQDFLYFWLSFTAKNYVSEGMGNPKLMSNVLSTIPIPLPPIPIQEKIVEILDKFTSLEEQLEAELEARRKQYEYYREKLLTFSPDDKNVRWVTLGKICDTLSGFPFDSSKFKEEGVQLMRGANVKRGYFDFSQEINKYWDSSDGLEKYLLAPNDIIISMDGSLVGRSFSYIKEEHLPLLLVQRVARLRTKENYKYIYFCISKSFPDYVDKKKTAGAIPHISLKDINSFPIPLPPLSEQRRIVAILDRFEALTNDLQAGLPAELMARRQQYEYYREKLLTFKRKTV